MKKVLLIDGNRSGYAPEQCGETMTINQLISQLQGLKQYCGGDTEIYLNNDNGYTYGEINENTMEICKITESGGTDCLDYDIDGEEGHRGDLFDMDYEEK